MTAFGSNAPGQPAISAYRKPWKVNSGSQVIGPFPARVRVSVALASLEWAGAELVVLEHLRVPQGDHRAGRAVDGQPQPAHQVLAEVQDRPTGRGGDHLLDGHLLDPADDRRGASARGGKGLPGGRCGPAGVVEPGAVPTRRRESDVVVLAGVDPAGGDRSGRDPPGLVRGHDLPASVRVRDHQLPRHGGLVGVEGCGLTTEAVPLGGPAAGEADPERVGAGDEQLGHVGRLVDETPLVRRPARLEHLVVHVGAVDAGLVDPETGRVQDRRHDVVADRELGPGESGLRPGRGLGQGDRCGDPLPVGQEAGPDAQRLTPLGGDARRCP